MKTIGIDASRANLRYRTGTEWYCFQLLHHFAKLIPPNDYRVILYVKEPLLPDLQTLPKHWQVKVLHWPPRLLWTQLRLSLHLLRPSQRPDVLFIPAHTIPLIHPQRTVYVAHDLGFERQPSLYANTYIGGRLMNLLVRLLTLGRYGTSERDYHRWSMRYAAVQASRIITISQFTKSELQHFYHVPVERITVVYNGYNSATLLPSPLTGTAVQPRDYFLYIGRIEHKKNIVNLLKGFAEFRRVTASPLKLCLVGQFGHGESDIWQTIRNEQLTDAVLLPGYVQQSELSAYWQRALAFVFPTNYEGFGIPILEAMSAGTVVACSDIPPLRELGEDNCLYFDQQSSAAIAQVLQKIVQLLPAERDRMIVAGRARAQLFSWENCASHTWQVIEGQLH
jgi:glycosyltransferase involved in cell wall biosynthesis